jgi:hypothetical protein
VGKVLDLHPGGLAGAVAGTGLDAQQDIPFEMLCCG